MWFGACKKNNHILVSLKIAEIEVRDLLDGYEMNITAVSDDFMPGIASFVEKKIVNNFQEKEKRGIY